MAQPSAIIIGHSFVRRYEKWLQTPHNMAPTPTEICGKLSAIEMLGISGLQTSQLHEGDLFFQASKHDIVVIDCSTNDLANMVPEKEIAHNVLLFARRCILHGVTTVTIMSVIPRTQGFRRGCDATKFAKSAQEYNRILRTMCVAEKQIAFQRHKGFADVKMSTWTDDGIHPTTRRRSEQHKSGMEKYHQSIVTALHHAVHRHRLLKTGQ